MVLLSQNCNKLYIGLENKLLEYRQTENSVAIKLPDIIVPPNLSKGQEDVFKRGENEIILISHSKHDKYTAISTENKQVVVFNNDFNVIKNFVLNRAASAISFTPDCNLLVADKTGDAYLYNLQYVESVPPVLILGHLSMLLDICVTDCNKFIITCDRDEKIRVSHYPNSYNILSYCLGHDEFVTNLQIIDDVLISASGDGTIRFWNYKSGRQLQIINTNESIKDKCCIDSFCKKMEEDNVDVKAVPITDMQVYQHSTSIFIAVTLHGINCILVYCINFIDNSIIVKDVQNIVLQHQLVSFSLGPILYVLTVENLICYKLNNTYELHNDGLLNKFYSENKDILLKCIKDKDVSVLYKRKFDNVQEYMDRKKMRVEKK